MSQCVMFDCYISHSLSYFCQIPQNTHKNFTMGKLSNQLFCRPQKIILLNLLSSFYLSSCFWFCVLFHLLMLCSLMLRYLCNLCTHTVLLASRHTNICFARFKAAEYGSTGFRVFKRGGYKIENIFGKKSRYPKEIVEF